MASADQLKALVKSHISRDDNQFYSVAMQVAAHEAKAGHGKLAEELRDMIDAAKTRSISSEPGKLVPLARPRGELANLLDVSYPKNRLADMVLDPTVFEQLQRIMKEQRLHARVDLPAPGMHLGQGRARQQAPLRARMLRPHALVVAVEEHAERGIEGLEAGLEALEQEGLEEPGGMRQVPFGRAGLGHRLQLAILGRQRRGQRRAARAHRGIGRAKLRGLRQGVHGRSGHCSAVPRACQRGARKP